MKEVRMVLDARIGSMHRPHGTGTTEYRHSPVIYLYSALNCRVLSPPLTVKAPTHAMNTFWFLSLSSGVGGATILGLKAWITSPIGTLSDDLDLNHATSSSLVIIPSNGSISSGAGVGVLDPFFFFLGGSCEPETGDGLRLELGLGEGAAEAEADVGCLLMRGPIEPVGEGALLPGGSTGCCALPEAERAGEAPRGVRVPAALSGLPARGLALRLRDAGDTPRDVARWAIKDAPDGGAVKDLPFFVGDR
jgi:hypothetical protein